MSSEFGFSIFQAFGIEKKGIFAKQDHITK